MLADALPIYPLYALLFQERGLSGAQISLLFAIWSAVGLVAEVPTGLLADRFSRRGAVVSSTLLQALAYGVWILRPDLTGFAAGFVLWGIGGALASGALEALIYDALAEHGAVADFARVNARISAAGLIGQIPAAAGATLLFPLGGYALVGWVSAGLCVAASLVAAGLPEPPRSGAGEDGDGRLTAAVRGAWRVPAVRLAVIAVAAVEGVDALEEYFTLLARDWGVATHLVPVAVVAIPLVGAAGAVLGGRLPRATGGLLGAVLATGALLLLVAALIPSPIGIGALIVLYGGSRLVAAVTEARLQERIRGPHRATITSVAGLATELAGFAVYGAWAAGQAVGAAVLVAVVAALLPALLAERATG